MTLFDLGRQNKETTLTCRTSRITMEEVKPHVLKLHPKVGIRMVGKQKMCLRMKMSKPQQQIMLDYLNFMFN